MSTARKNIEIIWTRTNRHQIHADGCDTGMTARIVKIGTNHGCAAEIRIGRKVLVKADVDRMVSASNHDAAIMLALDSIGI